MAVMVFVILGLDEILGGSLVFPLSITAKPFSVSAKKNTLTIGHSSRVDHSSFWQSQKTISQQSTKGKLFHYRGRFSSSLPGGPHFKMEFECETFSSVVREE